jgi:hypothetical protein
MAKARLLQAVCAVALLAAAPAFAQQTITQPATTGAGNSVNAPVIHDQTPPGPTAQSSMAPAEKMDQTGGMGRHSTHHSAMSGHSGMHARNDSSRNSAADQLNEQSYQAAQRGQSFSASDSGSSGAMSPAPSGSMNDMSGGSPVPAASGAGGGTGSR